MKRRLDLATQNASSFQKDAEEFRLKVDELKREELRLKMELGRAQIEIKNLKASILKAQKAAVQSNTGNKAA